LLSLLQAELQPLPLQLLLQLLHCVSAALFDEVSGELWRMRVTIITDWSVTEEHAESCGGQCRIKQRAADVFPASD